MSQAKAFDAREALMRESSRSPDARWRTVSLVTAVRGLVAWSPVSLPAWPQRASVADPGSLLEAFGAATQQLTQRGLDSDSLIRYGLRNEIVGSLMGLLITKRLELATPELVQRPGLDLDAWVEILPGQATMESGGDITIDRIRRAAETTIAHLPLFLTWIATAPLDDFVTLKAPGKEILSGAIAPSGADTRLYEQYAWLIDRFSTTSYRDWLTSSLYYEFRWKEEQEPPPCPVGLMLDREVSPDELNGEIARRAALDVSSGGPDPEAGLVVEMESHARVLLRQGRCREAATLFEFALQRRPEDAIVRNDLGFCLVSEDPEQALFHLEAAARMGYAHRVVNVYNQVCCQLVLRRPRPAVATADEYWSARDDFLGGATLWVRTEDSRWVIAEVADPHTALASLIAGICQEEGWRDEERLWLSRIPGQINQ